MNKIFDIIYIRSKTLLIRKSSWDKNVECMLGLELFPGGHHSFIKLRKIAAAFNSAYLIFPVSSGTALNKSATSPWSATWKIGASGSLLIATIVFESFIPARC